VAQIPLLFDQFSPSIIILDKAYDGNVVLEFFETQSTIPVIPPKTNRVVQTVRFIESAIESNAALKNLNNSAMFFAFR